MLAPFFTSLAFVQHQNGLATAPAGSSYEFVIYNVDSTPRRDGYLASLPVARRLDGLIAMALPFEHTAGWRLVQAADAQWIARSMLLI